MNLKNLSRILVVVCCVAVGARAGETLVTINPELHGAWVTPDGAWDGRAVLLLHGFASDMDDAGGLFKRLAGELAAQGVASLRINFRGEGDAARTDIESTFTTRLEDAAAAHQFLLAQAHVDAKRIGVVGFSLGASTAIVTGGRHPDWFRTMCVWSSPGGDLYASMQTGELAGAFAGAERTGTGAVEFPGWKTVTLHKAFFESFRGIDTDRSLEKFPGAFLVVDGGDDYLPPQSQKFMKLAPGRPAEAVIIAGADHIFHVFDGEKGQSARLLEVTVAWFGRTL